MSTSTEHTASDFLLDYEGDPAALDRTLQDLPGVAVTLAQGEAAPGYLRHEGHYVARVFGGSSANRMFEFMVENQGYCTVIRELDELL